MKYNMNLKLGPFTAILEGLKTIEMRLWDEKRQQFKLGDYIEFDCKACDKIITAKIIGLFVCPSFERLYQLFPKTNLGYKSDEPADYTDMLEFYPQELIHKFGVVGIEIQVTEIK